MKRKVAVLGSGIMGGIWIERLLATQAVERATLMACDTDKQRLHDLQARFGIHTSVRNGDGAAFGDIIVLAPPPQAAAPILEEIQDSLTDGKLVLSLAAGVTLAALRRHVPASVPIVRVMPNTPSLVGKGMNPVAFEPGTVQEVRTAVLSLLQFMGDTVEISDAQMNVACALCAVGPTYLLPAVSALANAAGNQGLSPHLALRMAGTVAEGVGALICRTKSSTDDLKDLISLHTIDEAALEKIMAAAFIAAFDKLNTLEAKLSPS